MSGISVTCQGLLFDMDGVLVSSIGSVNRCWRQWAVHYGVPNAETFEVPHGTRAVEIIKALKPGLDVAEGLRLIEDMEIADVSDLRVLPGAQALLEGLPTDRWAIVTSATRRLLIARLKEAGLIVPERIVSADMVERGKPDPEPYRRGAGLIASSGVPPAECIVVEDAVSGVCAGVAAGCRVLAVLGSYSDKELREAGASWVVGTLESVRAELNANGLSLRFDFL